MKAKTNFMKYVWLCLILFCSTAPSIVHAASAQMQDYCQVPPFIGVTKPNLLLMIDNSASMYDLEYVDMGKKACSNNTSTVCTTDSDCASGGTCTVVQRSPMYCYDESYSSENDYDGYFSRTQPNSTVEQYYQYSFTNGYFSPVSTFPSSISSCGLHTATKFIADALCVDITDTTPHTVVSFIASGNYLNWLSASKFDVEKSILTGGKYGAIGSSGTGSGLIAETRGCVGRKYVKEAITSDFQNYSTGATDPNTSLGITFGVRGPADATNPSDVSQGGQTSIDIFYGNYNAALCQQAITDYQDTSVTKQTLVDDVAACLSYSATNRNTCQNSPTTICNSDSDCIISSGTCGTGSSGTCSITTNNGTCAATTSGTCTANNGTCVGTSSKTCSGGGKAGATCNNDHDCQISTCTSGNVGVVCSQNSDCNLYTCTNSGITYGKSCAVNSDCNTGTCSAPASKLGVSCATNSDCNANTCTSGPFAGQLCSSNWDCSSNLGHCLPPLTPQLKSTFAQSMNSCYLFSMKGQDVGSNEVQQVDNPAGCNQIYSEYRICNGGAHDGLQCSSSADCGGYLCLGGPEAIRPGSPVLLCGATYAGYCAANPNNDNWATTDWVQREYGSVSDCILAKYRQYCNSLQVPPVSDPTTSLSSTPSYMNLPAIINDLGVGGQLNNPIATLQAGVQTTSPPRGLIQDFASIIRIGAMSFDFNGSATECAVRNNATGTISGNGPAYCSNNSSRSCTSDSGCVSPGVCNPLVPCPYVCNSSSSNPGAPCSLLPGGVTNDCPAGSCILATSGSTNLDGGHVLSNSYIGNTIPVTPNQGHGVAGVINDIDGLTANAWTPFSEGFYNSIGYFANTSSMQLNSTDFSTTPAPSQSDCQKNNILLITDGQSTADLNNAVSSFISTNSSLLPSTMGYDTSPNNACIPYVGSRNVEPLAWLGQNRDILDISSETPANYRQKIFTYVVYSGTGSLDSETCSNQTATQLASLSDCQPDDLMCKTARYGGGTYYLAQDPATLKTSLKDAFLEIAARATSGTAASVLASGEGSGANLIQALFYPRRQFDFNTETYWAGTLQNLWYYVDPFFTYSNIREDTDQDKVLNLKDDDIANLFFNPDPTVNRVQVKLYADANGDGAADSSTPTSTINIEDIKSLWEAGIQLWGMSPGPSSRHIYTNCSINTDACIDDASGNNTNLMNFYASNLDSSGTLQSYIQAGSMAEADKIVRYTRGYDRFCTGTATGCRTDADCTSPATCSDTPYRQRTVTIDLNDNGTADTGETNVWKLGDVLNSTPKIASWMPLNTYNLTYNDSTYGIPGQTLYPEDGHDETRFITTLTSSPAYQDRGMVFAGANDGMLHAFRLGTLQLHWAGQGDFDKGRLLRTCTTDSTRVCTSNSDCAAGDTCPALGQEMWAYLPKNTLPYLKYMADQNYCHIYSVDLTPYIFDASIEGPSLPSATCTDTSYYNCTKNQHSWRTIVIGGMRYGGACKVKVCSGNTTIKCKDDSPCTAAGAGTCVNPSANDIGTPLLDSSGNGLGYSSYFALDVTDNLSDASKPPKLLWEFTNNDLGFSTTGPAIVRINSGGDAWPTINHDGRWFVVFGSGPTGPISDSQFMGSSDQNLKLFVLDLRTGTLLNTIDTGIPNAFAGSMLNATFDSNLDYQDDAVYFGYVKEASGGTWTDGGVGRLITNGSTDPANWEFSKVIDGIGPVTAGVVKLQDNPNGRLWLYFGTGRYYYKTTTTADDVNTVRSLYGVTDPCFQTGSTPFHSSCSASIYTRSRSDLNDATDVSNASTSYTNGWYIDMAGPYTDPDATLSLGAERVITDPLASTTGVVLFTTYAPYSYVCTLGGKSYLWAVYYGSGGGAGAMLKGKALVQVSTGSIEQLDLSTAFSGAGSEGGRKSYGLEGVPPTGGGLSLLAQPPPVKRVIHMKER